MGFFGWDEAARAHDQTYTNGQPDFDNQASFGHELLGGAAAFEAMRQYEKHQDANGRPQSHEMAKEILAGFAGAEADRLLETKGEDFYDREKFRHHAKQQAEHLYDQRMGGERDGRY